MFAFSKFGLSTPGWVFEPQVGFICSKVVGHCFLLNVGVSPGPG